MNSLPPQPTREARPFVKWVGGKRGLLPAIRPLVPSSIGTYYEPFVGGGALYFALAPKRAVLGDLNPELITAYTVVRDAIDDLLEVLRGHDTCHRADLESAVDGRGSHANFPYYYDVRALRPEDLTPVQVAARLIYLNRTCYNGLYRVNARNEFNVPAGRYRTPDIVAEENLRRCSAHLARVDLHSGDFADIEPRPGDFVFLDPPYDPRDDAPRVSHAAYVAGGFGPDEQVRVRDLAVQLRHRGVRVLICNHDTQRVRRLYLDEAHGFTVHQVMASRSINSRAAGRGKVPEVLIAG